MSMHFIESDAACPHCKKQIVIVIEKKSIKTMAKLCKKTAQNNIKDAEFFIFTPEQYAESFKETKP